MMPLRVAFVHTDLRVYWPPRLRRLSRHLSASSSRLYVMEIAGNGSPYDFAGRDKDALSMSWSILFPEGNLRQLRPARMAREVERKLDEIRPDVVLAGGMAYPSGAAAVRWCRRNRRGVVIFDNVRKEDVPRSRLVNWIKSRIYGNVDAMLIPAESHCPSYESWGVSKARLFFGLNVIDNERFAQGAQKARDNRASVRAMKGLPANFFLGVGRLIPQKNWRAMVEGYAAYRGRSLQQPWGLILVGDGAERAPLEELIRRRNVDGVRLAGAVVGDELCDYYGLAGCLILPSHGETWGLVVNEAMACGLPVLVSDRCGCCRTLVRPGENGWPFSPGEPGQLTDRMLRMAGQTEAERGAMGEKSREIISEWSLDRFVQGASGAIECCRDVRRGFACVVDEFIINHWHGRFRPV